jgi:hypothetical protein
VSDRREGRELGDLADFHAWDDDRRLSGHDSPVVVELPEMIGEMAGEMDDEVSGADGAADDLERERLRENLVRELRDRRDDGGACLIQQRGDLRFRRRAIGEFGIPIARVWSSAEHVPQEVAEISRYVKRKGSADVRYSRNGLPEARVVRISFDRASNGFDLPEQNESGRPLKEIVGQTASDSEVK